MGIIGRIRLAGSERIRRSAIHHDIREIIRIGERGERNRGKEPELGCVSDSRANQAGRKGSCLPPHGEGIPADTVFTAFAVWAEGVGEDSRDAPVATHRLPFLIVGHDRKRDQNIEMGDAAAGSFHFSRSSHTELQRTGRCSHCHLHLRALPVAVGADLGSGGIGDHKHGRSGKDPRAVVHPESVYREERGHEKTLRHGIRAITDEGLHSPGSPALLRGRSGSDNGRRRIRKMVLPSGDNPSRKPELHFRRLGQGRRECR